MCDTCRSLPAAGPCSSNNGVLRSKQVRKAKEVLFYGLLLLFELSERSVGSAVPVT